MLKNRTETLLKRYFKNSRLYFKCLSTTTDLHTVEKHHTFRTNETNPQKHTADHEGQFYSISDNLKKQVFLHGGLPKSFEIQNETFAETCLMIRKPSLDIINYMKVIDYSKPTIRFVLYGKKGNGKSLSLAHILHYAFIEDFLIVHVPWVGNWMRRCKEVSNSESMEGFIDLNIDAAAWLVHFKTQNSHLLTNPKYQTSVDYVWNKREMTPKGSPLTELVEHGINRIKYASMSTVALCNEIKELAKQKICKVFVAIDGYNAFFYPNTRVFIENKQMIPPNKVTLTEGFLNLSKFDWNNSVVVVTVDEIAIAEKDQISHLPRYLLGKNGFEFLDPFIPIHVPTYNKKEFRSCMDYYKERKWVTPYPNIDEQVEFISGSNPYKLMKLSAGL